MNKPTDNDVAEASVALFGDRAYLERMTDHPLLSAAQEKAIARRIAAGDQRAKAQLITHNVRLVVKIARSYNRNDGPWVAGGLELADLVQEGMIGLNRAAEKFDPERGFKFSTYATNWIKQSIGRALSNTDQAIRLPVNVGVVQRKIAALQSARAKAGLEEPLSDECVAELIEHSVSEVKAARNAAAVSTSLNKQIGEDGDELLALIANEQVAEVSHEADQGITREQVTAAIERLKPRERDILIKRLIEEKSLETTAAELGVSKQRVREQERRALGKTRRALTGSRQSTAPAPYSKGLSL